MNVSINIVDSSEWSSLGKKALMITPLDVQSAFELGVQFNELFTHNQKCGVSIGCQVVIPLVNRDDHNNPVVNLVDDDEPPF